MSRRKYILEVEGCSARWSFDVEADRASVDAWRRDGLEVFSLVNTIPARLPAPLIRLWCWVQDVFHFSWLRRRAVR